MSTQDLHFEKVSLINWITRLQDSATISKLKKIQSAVDSAEIEVPEWHKEIVRERISATSKEDYISFDELDGLMNLEDE